MMEMLKGCVVVAMMESVLGLCPEALRLSAQMFAYACVLNSVSCHCAVMDRTLESAAELNRTATEMTASCTTLLARLRWSKLAHDILRYRRFSSMIGQSLPQ